jgi:hypothetical protein
MKILNAIQNGAYSTALGKKVLDKAISINSSVLVPSKGKLQAHFLPLWAFKELLDEVGMDAKTSGKTLVITIQDGATSKDSVHIVCTK